MPAIHPLPEHQDVARVGANQDFGEQETERCVPLAWGATGALASPQPIGRYRFDPHDDSVDRLE